MPLSDDDFINEDHIEAFASALIWDDMEDQDSILAGLASPNSPLLDGSRSPGDYASRKALVNGSSSDSTMADREAQAFESTDLELNADVLSPVKPPDTPSTPKPKASKIVSKSDWFPSAVDSLGRKKKKPQFDTSFTNEFRMSSSYTIFRWPILIFIITWVLFLCTIYAIIRAYVALLEFFFTWTGERNRLRQKLRQSKSYGEWTENAKALDQFLGLDKWSENPKFSYYDHHTVSKIVRRLRVLRRRNDVRGLMVFLQSCLKKNFAGIENRQLYSHRYYGTKNLVGEYVEEVIKLIDCVAQADKTQLAPSSKRKFFRIVLKNYGKTALCLSGGACFAYTHFGLVKAMLDNDALPRIISGTSGGGLIAALACTRTDEELKELLVPELAQKITACEDPWYVWIPRWWNTGARFDAVAWARKSNFFTRGSTTFQEAYLRSGRKLNISTVPAEPHSPVILCNTVTSPDCIIWSSLLASSAVPGILNPVVLMMKDSKTDKATPFSMGNKWRDGSLRTDIPIDALNSYYNVNFSIVSQVNPHISLFFYAPKGTVGKPVPIARRKTRKHKFASLRGGFFATAVEQLLKLEIKKWLQIIKLLDLFPRWLAQDWLNVFLQRFTGTITIWPRIKFKDFFYILLDPNEAQMDEYLMKGQRSMFPSLLFVKHRLGIERAIERGLDGSRTINKKSLRKISESSSPIITDELVQRLEEVEDETDTTDQDTPSALLPLIDCFSDLGDDDDDDDDDDDNDDDDLGSSSEND